MRQILVSNQKGGVGKTTISLWLTFLLAKIGKKVGIKDLDTQKDLEAFITYYKIPIVSNQEAEIIVVDTPPKISDIELLNLAKQSQKIVIPFIPYFAGLDRTLRILKILYSEKHKIALVLNLFHPKRILHQEFLEFLRHHRIHTLYPLFIFRNTIGIQELNLSKLQHEEKEMFKKLLKFILTS